MVEVNINAKPQLPATPQHFALEKQTV